MGQSHKDLLQTQGCQGRPLLHRHKKLFKIDVEKQEEKYTDHFMKSPGFQIGSPSWRLGELLGYPMCCRHSTKIKLTYQDIQGKMHFFRHKRTQLCLGSVDDLELFWKCFVLVTHLASSLPLRIYTRVYLQENSIHMFLIQLHLTHPSIAL